MKGQSVALAGAAGIIFGTLVILANVVTPRGPAFFGPASDFLSYYAANQGAIEAGNFLFGLGAIAFLLFLVGLRLVLSRIEGEPAVLAWASLAAGVAALTLGLAGDGVVQGLAVDADNIRDAELTKLFATTSTLVRNFAFFPLALAIGAASGVMLHAGGAGRWIAWFGLLGMLLQLLAALSIAFPTGPVVPAIQGAFWSFSLWAVVTGLWLIGQRHRATA